MNAPVQVFNAMVTRCQREHGKVWPAPCVFCFTDTLLAAETETRERVETETAREAAKVVCGMCADGDPLTETVDMKGYPYHRAANGYEDYCRAVRIYRRFPSAAIRNLPPSSTPTTNTEGE